MTANPPAPAPSERERLIADVSDWLGFSASVIKSGEPWTKTCQSMHDRAKLAFIALQAADMLCVHMGEVVIEDTPFREGGRELSEKTPWQSSPVRRGGHVGCVAIGSRVIVPGYAWSEDTQLHEVYVGCFEAGRAQQRFWSSPRGWLFLVSEWWLRLCWSVRARFIHNHYSPGRDR